MTGRRPAANYKSQQGCETDDESDLDDNSAGKLDRGISRIHMQKQVHDGVPSV
jgi:hypothetical protein